MAAGQVSTTISSSHRGHFSTCRSRRDSTQATPLVDEGVDRDSELGGVGGGRFLEQPAQGGHLQAPQRVGFV